MSRVPFETPVLPNSCTSPAAAIACTSAASSPMLAAAARASFETAGEWSRVNQHLMSANCPQHSSATVKRSPSRGSDGMGSASIARSHSESSSMPARIAGAWRRKASATAGS